MNVGEPKVRYCGRSFSMEEMQRVRDLIAADPPRNRAELSRVVCEQFGWLRADGQRKDMSCRVAMLRMERDGLIQLPLPEGGNGTGRRRPPLTSASDPRESFTVPIDAVAELSLQPVATAEQSALWNEMIERYHPLGYTPLPGAQLRYLAFSGVHLLAALGFGAAAWSLAPRDRFIGWTREERTGNLDRVVNNARFLIPPWVRSQNLASRLLAYAARRLPGDWENRYGVRPVLLETFVEKERYRGTCYRAANWIYVGETQGRGKKDRRHRHAVPIKDILLYPLHSRFRRMLCSSRPSR